ncbi:MAG: DUF4199 domain-containing protein [Cytophagaceae bacterium]|nr:MAG: DUF4199 domain-containing protein [Cytophagaceae bacterium]
MENHAISPATPTSVGLRYGLLAGLLGVLISFGVNALQLEATPVRFVSWVVLALSIVLAQRDFKRQHAGFIDYGQALGVGMVVTLVYGVLSGIFAYIYANFIDPEIVVRAMEKARTEMEAKGSLSDAQIDQAMALSAKFISGPFIIAVIVILSLLTGLLISLISSFVVKNSKPEFE